MLQRVAISVVGLASVTAFPLKYCAQAGRLDKSLSGLDSGVWSLLQAAASAWLRITGKFPGYLSPSAGLKFADVPNGLAAISKAQPKGIGLLGDCRGLD